MSVRVVARVRPLLKAELDKDIIVTASSAECDSGRGNTVVTIPNPKNEGESFNFQFNSVYGPETSQQELFEKEGKDTSPCAPVELRSLLTWLSFSLAHN